MNVICNNIIIIHDKICYETYVFFGEDSGKAEVTRHLGLKQTVFPQVCIQPICRRGNLWARLVRSS